MNQPTDYAALVRALAQAAQGKCYASADLLSRAQQAIETLVRERDELSKQVLEVQMAHTRWAAEHERCIEEEAAAFHASLDKALDRAEKAERERDMFKGYYEAAHTDWESAEAECRRLREQIKTLERAVTQGAREQRRLEKHIAVLSPSAPPAGDQT